MRTALRYIVRRIANAVPLPRWMFDPPPVVELHEPSFREVLRALREGSPEGPPVTSIPARRRARLVVIEGKREDAA